MPPHAPLFVTSSSGRFTPALAATADSNVGTPSAGTYPAANRAIYIPLVLPHYYHALRAFWVNGGTVTANVDVGIFSGTTLKKLFSTGNTAQSGTNVPQYVTVDWLIPPGEYYLALSFSNGTASLFRSTTAELAEMRLIGYLQESTANPLPATMTPAAVATAYIPLFGMTRTSTGF